jgi:hypothetical protein
MAYHEPRVTRLRHFMDPVHPSSSYGLGILGSVDIDALLREGSATKGKRQHDLAEGLTRTVLPIFIHDEMGRPLHLGSCVLVRLDGRHYAFTAGHVIRDAQRAHLWAAAGNAKLEPLPYATLFSSEAAAGEVGDIDIGIVPLRAGSLGPFAECRFLDDIDDEGTTQHNWIDNFYFVMGYPASHKQSEINYRRKKIHVRSFHLATNPPQSDLYDKEGLDRSLHLLVEFDHNDTVVERKKAVPPNPRGVSGGAILCIARASYAGPLVAIATEHRKHSRILVGTRVRYFVQIARGLAATEPAEIFE